MALKILIIVFASGLLIALALVSGLLIAAIAQISCSAVTP